MKDTYVKLDKWIIMLIMLIVCLVVFVLAIGCSNLDKKIIRKEQKQSNTQEQIINDICKQCNECKDCKCAYLSATTFFKSAQDEGYANGLMMARRVLGEQSWMLENRVIDLDEVKSSEQIIIEMYELGESILEKNNY